MRSTPQPLIRIRQYLDTLLQPASSDDQEGNGLLVDGPTDVRKIGAALNTSFWSIDAAAAEGVDLLLVHHAPWASIDLDLRDHKLTRLHELRIALYAAHDTLDRAKNIGVGIEFARLVGLDVEAEDAEQIVALAGSRDRDEWLVHLATVLKTRVRAWPNNPVFKRICVVPGGGGTTDRLAAAAKLGCDTFLTGEGSLYTELFAREMGLTLVYASHVATEFPGICALAAHVAEEFKLPWVALPESPEITGGGRAPLEY